MRSQHGSFTERFAQLDWAVEQLASEGNLTANTYHFSVSAFNRVGRGLLSGIKSITTVAGDKIRITLGSSLVQPGEDVWGIIVSCQTTGNQNEAVQVAMFDVRDRADQVSTFELPGEIEFTEDYQLETIDLAVDSSGDLPLAVPHGAVRTITDESDRIVFWSAIAAQWENYFFDSIFTYLGNPQNEEGSDQILGADPIIPPLMFDTEVSRVTTTKERYWLVNEAAEGQGADLEGNINLRIFINGATTKGNIIWGNVFAGLIKFELVGYYRLLSRGLDSSLDFVGVTQEWHPAENQLTLPDPLPAGYAAVYDIWLDGDTSLFSLAGYEASDVLSISFDYLGKVGRYIPELAALIGEDMVFADRDRLLVLPNKILSGSAIVKKFFFEKAREEKGIFSDVSPNTPNQNLIINGATGGTIRTSTSSATLSSEAIRATFSTEAGYTNPSDYSNEVTLSESSGLRITLNNPVGLNNKATVRSDYPDPLIAGNDQADWDNPLQRIYLVLNDLTIYEQQTPVTSGSSATQTIEITDLSDYLDVTENPPQDAEVLFGSNFSLFKPGTPELEELVGGSLPAGTYKVAVRIEYPEPNYSITRLDQSSSHLIPQLNQTFAEALAGFKIWQDKRLTTEEMRSLPTADRVSYSVWINTSFGNVPYILDPTITSEDDGRNVIRFDNGIGGFIPLKSFGTAWGNSTGEILDRYSTVRVSAPLNAIADPQSAAIALYLDTTQLTSFRAYDTLVDSAGDILTDTAGNILII